MLPREGLGPRQKLDAQDEMKTAQKTNQKDHPTCAHSNCGCHVEATGDYCSTECEASAAGHAKHGQSQCDCGHADCRQKPHAAKVQIGY